MRASAEPHLVTSFYQELGEACDCERRPTDTAVVAGDFNAEVGCREEGEERTLGKYGVGARSQSGDELAELLVQKGLCTASVHFKHRRVQTADCSMTARSPRRVSHRREEVSRDFTVKSTTC